MKYAATLIGGFLVGCLALWAYKRNDGKPAGADKAAAGTAAAVVVAARADTVYDTTRIGYTVWRDRVLKSGTATPNEKVTFGKCDAVVLTCEARHVADQAVGDSLRKELGVWKDYRGPRVQGFGEGMYDLAHQVPVLRVGATARLLGPVHLSVAGEYAAPPAGESRPAFRALAGLRVNF